MADHVFNRELQRATSFAQLARPVASMFVTRELFARVDLLNIWW
jgi:hypothetical protein